MIPGDGGGDRAASHHHIENPQYKLESVSYDRVTYIDTYVVELPSSIPYPVRKREYTMKLDTATVLKVIEVQQHKSWLASDERVGIEIQKSS